MVSADMEEGLFMDRVKNYHLPYFLRWPRLRRSKFVVDMEMVEVCAKCYDQTFR